MYLRIPTLKLQIKSRVNCAKLRCFFFLITDHYIKYKIPLKLLIYVYKLSYTIYLVPFETLLTILNYEPNRLQTCNQHVIALMDMLGYTVRP